MAGDHVRTEREIQNLVLDDTNDAVKVNVVAGSSSSTQYAEDTAHNAGDTGTMTLAVRKDSAGTLAGTDGDYAPLQLDSNGALRVTGGGGSGGTQYAGDDALGATPTGNVAIAQRDDALSTLTPIEGDAVPHRVDSEGALWTRDKNLTDVISGNEMQVDVVASLPAGTNAIGKLAANSGVDIGDVTLNGGPSGASALEIQGTAAADAAIANNPLPLALRASTNEPTAVSADGDAVHPWADRRGRQVTLEGHANPESPVSQNATASGNTTVIAAPGASLSLYIKKASVHNADSSTVTVKLQDGAGGTTRWQALLAADGGGSIIDFGSRGWKLTANTLLNVNLSGAGNVDVNITEYYIE